MPQEQDAQKIVVPKEDPAQKEKSFEQKDDERAEKAREFEKKKPDDAKDDEEMSEEDKKLKSDLDLMVTRVLETGLPNEDEIRKMALEGLRTAIRSATTSMTSVPKPLKFLRPHFPALAAFHLDLAAGPNKLLMSDILSVMAMTMGKVGERQSLQYKLSGTEESLTAWGHEYVRNLAGEIGGEFHRRIEEEDKVDDLLALVDEIIPFNMQHNAEFEAIDLLLEVDKLELLPKFITRDNFLRICRYVVACASYMGDPDESRKMVRLAFEALLENGDYSYAYRLALRLEDREAELRVLQSVPEDEPAIKKQLGFIASVQRRFYPELEDDDELCEIIGNVKLSSYFLALGKELGVLEPKTPEDIYKSHLEEGKKAAKGAAAARGAAGAAAGAPAVDSAKQNLAATFVNAFVNCGFGRDTLLTPEGSDWLYKNKSHGMISAAGSLGLILLWDVETGFSAMDKYSFSSQEVIKAGALLASGILSSGVTSDMNATLALLEEHIQNKNKDMRLCAILGLGLSYAGTGKEELLEPLVTLMVEANQPMEIVSIACLTLGLVFCGTANVDISGSIIEALMDRSDTDLKDSNARIMCLGLGLIFLGRGEEVEGVMGAIKAVEKPFIARYLELTVQTCAYVGSCSVLELQKLLTALNEHNEDDENDPHKGIHQEVAVLGVAMIAMGEPIGQEMALRALDHILQYGELNVRRVVPLAYALLSVSNPRLTVMDTLSKLSHDQDERVSQNACLALGFLGAGTNNSRIAGLLRQLAGFYSKEPNHLFLVRIAQGLLHLGKGCMTLNPFHSDNALLSKVAMAGLLTVMHASLDLKHSILGERHYLLFALVTAIRPRMLVTLDEDLNSIPISVRVGQAVDTVGQAGKPRSITGFQTHNTPVLLGAGDRAELATDEFLPMSDVLEGFVVTKKNPNATKEEQ